MIHKWGLTLVLLGLGWNTQASTVESVLNRDELRPADELSREVEKQSIGREMAEFLIEQDKALAFGDFSNASSSDFHPLSAYDIQDRDSRHPHPTPPERRPPGHARPNPPPHHQPPGYRHPNPPPPHQPPRYGRPGPPPPSYYYACYAENYRGQRFVSYGYWPRNVQQRAIEECYRRSLRCYELGCY